MTSETELQQQVADYLRLQYSDVLFHSDFGSGIKLTAGQAMKQKRQNGGRRGWPDMFIAEPRTTTRKFDEITGKVIEERLLLAKEIDSWAFEEDYDSSFGLFLELKKDGTHLKKRNGDWANKHIATQANVLQQLRERGYCAEFAVGFDEAKKIIDEYLGG